ncbi:transposase [Streptomyces globisporus]|nr:transposase [Streptomyces mediolani]WSV94019.1 transposase [Streptomyces globisporus]
MVPHRGLISAFRQCLSGHRIAGPTVRDGEISDAAWMVIVPLLPPVGRARGRWRGHRQVLVGMVFKFRTGLPWRDLPERFGPWQTVHGRFARRAPDGTFDRLLSAAQFCAELDRLVAIDSTFARAHQHTAAVEHAFARPKHYKILRDCLQRGNSLHLAVQAVATLHNHALAA